MRDLTTIHKDVTVLTQYMENVRTICGESDSQSPQVVFTVPLSEVVELAAEWQRERDNLYLQIEVAKGRFRRIRQSAKDAMDDLSTAEWKRGPHSPEVWSV